MTKIICYANRTESILCTKKNEKKMLNEWFKKGDRDVDEYDRSEGNVIQIEVDHAVHGYDS